MILKPSLRFKHTLSLMGWLLYLVPGLSFALPQGFVYLDQIAPSIIIDMRYASPDNFTGRPVKGYLKPRCILSLPAASQLAKVQRAALKKGYTLKVYDCYRPQRAVNDFFAWSRRDDDTKLKNDYYPRIKKKNLFEKGYIAKYSGHSRGSTVDLSLVQTNVKPPPKADSNKSSQAPCYDSKRRRDNSIDMGTNFDCLDPSAHRRYRFLSAKARSNRKLLLSLMRPFGFRPYSKEWWHFTLRHEPYPRHYFDFPVR